MDDDPASDPYAPIAELYDLEHAGYDEDLDLYLSLARATGDPILELGCGSGRLLVPLAAAGHRVTGVDQSSAMLARARSAVADAGVMGRVTLQRGSMVEAEAAPGGPFGLVVLGLNGLLHLASAAAQRDALASIRRALDPRGQLVVDVLNPSPDALRALDAGLAHEGAWPHPAGGKVEKFAARRISPARQLIATDLWYDHVAADGTLRRVGTSYPMRYVHRAELELMLELVGFAEWQIYGGYELEPFDDAADRLIATAEVTRSTGLA